MKRFCVISNLGEILRTGTCQDTCVELQAGENEIAIEMTVDVTEDQYIDGGVIVQKSIKPSPNHIFDYTTKQWVDPRTIDDLKEAKNRVINAARLQANQSSFTYEGHQISCDALSRSDIDGVNGIVTLTNAMPPDWIGFWKTADNNYVAIPDVATWTLLYSAMVAQGQTNFAHAQELKAQLVLADTPDKVALVPDW